MPQFTPMELKLRIKRIPNHNELGVGFTTKERSNVETPPYIELQPRRTLSDFMEASSASSSSTAAPAPSATPDAAPAPAPIAVLDTLFERSTELHTLVLPTLRRKRTPTADSGAGGPGPATSEVDHESPLSSYTSLIRHVGSLLASLASQSSSPGTTPSPQQQKLHGILGSHPRLGAKKEAEKLKALNDEYEQRFPGLRYVVFVNGRSRPVVMEDMRRRIDRGDSKEEEQEAIKAMVDIALDRAKKLNAID
ncbi:uncharacterized protein PG986_001595 [Apiospora aurea]|uniref:Oxo-4-hydroxy-4-carboxy-5-ureidoimidazoline decarboxylase domain-containing protein n=1 Tax=Apiospora aurea TaxID=335848 RepID=A0ABR1QXD6_9PEZI